MTVWTYSDVLSVIATVLAILVSAGGAPYVVQQLKMLTGAQGNAARVLAVLVAVLFGVLTLLVDGTVGPDVITPANAGLVIGLIWAASQAEYQNIRRRLMEGESLSAE